MTIVKQADKQYEPAAFEQRVQAHWRETDAYRKTRAAREKGEPWYFIDGPPYATGHIHLGTAWNKTLKDAVLRYKAMRGFQVRDQPGFDMHGLPIEVKVEKDLGFNNKRDIEQYGIDRFVERCRTFAVDHLAIMTEEFKELGVWMDWDKPYRTIDNTYIEGAWWAIARARERGLLYASERNLTWCWRCETALAAAEVEYEDRKDPSVFVKFPVKGMAGEYLLIWTTTPWTLPANVAIAANPDIEYARVRIGNDVLIIAAQQAGEIARIAKAESFEILERFPGTQLEGLKYDHPYAAEVPYHRQPASEYNNRVILGAHVASDRSGLVHTATGHGVEDFEVGKKYGIPVFCPVGENGRYTEAVGPFKGLAVKAAPAEPKSEKEKRFSEADYAVIEDLTRKGLLLDSRMESHSYGHCWRCKQPIIFRSTRQWFIAIDPIKEKMMSETARVRWTPEWAGSARQMDWVRNARDWCISRQRYWGIPLPVWSCKSCQAQTVAKSGDDLLAKNAKGYTPGMDLHRPWIDGVTLPCACGGTMHREQDVLDVWFDSAVAAWAELEYPRKTSEFQKWFPCDFIVEGLDQTRGWFYSQLAASTASHGVVPYESVLMHGFVMDAQGEKMSKSLGNVITPHEVIVKHGADSFRFHVLGFEPWRDLLFGWDGVKNTQRMLNILWNVHVFATTYMALDKFDPAKHTAASLEKHFRVEDRWLRSRTQSLVKEVTGAFDRYHLHEGARALERFILDDLSRWYVRLTRDRTWTDNPEDPDKLACYRTLHDALMTVAKLMAPIAPHLPDVLYRDLGGEKATVHMEDWPVPEERLVDAGLEREMGAVRDLVEATANARQKANMKLRWPVGKIVLATESREVRDAVTRFRDIVLEQTNAKSVEFVTGEWEQLELVAVPNKAYIGKTLRAAGPQLLNWLKTADQATLRDLRRAQKTGQGAEREFGGTPVTLTADVLGFETKLPAGTTGADFPGGSVYLETEVTEELKAEGYSREVIRRIQEMRKEMSLKVDAPVRTEVKLPADFPNLTGWQKTIAEETRSRELAFVDAPKGKHVKPWDIEGAEVVIGITP
ncbi:MAG TPA: isoleucine--tRNA ligase [Candidatus Thermoplasmatota archaeon]|nr:isoleucine--tRNA ligase [Candidatus Thermoplasmatota archaeon]